MSETTPLDLQSIFTAWDAISNVIERKANEWKECKQQHDDIGAHPTAEMFDQWAFAAGILHSAVTTEFSILVRQEMERKTTETVS